MFYPEFDKAVAAAAAGAVIVTYWNACHYLHKTTRVKFGIHHCQTCTVNITCTLKCCTKRAIGVTQENQ